MANRARSGGAPLGCGAERARCDRARSALPFLVLGLMCLVHQVAAGAGKPPAEAEKTARWDVKDTHDRLDRIYNKLGIEEPEPESDQGCGCEPEEKRAEPEPKELPWARAPRMPAWLGYLMIGLISAAMLVPLFLVLRNSFASEKRADRPPEEEPEEQQAAAPTRGPWVVDLSECRRLVQQGRLAEAFAALHRLTLLGLQRMRQLTLDQTTTNWEYVRRLISRSELKQVLGGVTLAAEQSVLGHKPPGVERYEELERVVLQHVKEGRA